MKLKMESIKLILIVAIIHKKRKLRRFSQSSKIGCSIKYKYMIKKVFEIYCSCKKISRIL